MTDSPPHPRPCSRPPASPARAAKALAALILLLTGCADPLARIDDRTRKLIEARSLALGPDTIVPDRRGLSLDAYDNPHLTDKQPEAVNPAARDLTFRTFTEPRTDEQVADRLTAFAANASGLGPDPDGAAPLTPLPLTLQDALRFAQSTGPQYLFAEETYILAAIGVLQQRRLFSPRYFNDTQVQLQGFGREGNFQHANNIINTLRATQRLPSGGNLEASWVVRAADQLREQVTGGYEQSSTLALSADIPLLRGAGTVAREDLIQAERNLIYAARQFERDRRELLVDIAGDFFQLIQQLNGIDNLERQLASLVELEKATKARVDAGRLSEFQKQLSANQVLTAKANLAGARESFILARDQFKVRLGIPIETPLEIRPLEFDIPEPDVSLEEAAARALVFRLDLQNQRDQIDDARRAVRNARNALLPTFDLAGNVGIPTEPGDSTGGLSIDQDELNYSMSATFGLPLDREIERLGLRSSIIGLERAARAFDDFRDNVIITARQSVRQIDLARFQLELAKRSVEINEFRLEDLSRRDDADPQSVVDAENELINARNARDQALTDLRNAVLNYLLATGQLRVAKDGTFERLPGMEGQPVPEATPATP